MSKQYVVTETEFEALIDKLRVEQYNISWLQTELEILTREPTDKRAELALHAIFRHFNYHVVQWIQKMKE